VVDVFSTGKACVALTVLSLGLELDAPAFQDASLRQVLSHKAGHPAIRVDVPERASWKARYPNLQSAAVQAGVEIGFLHLGLSFLSRLVRMGLLRSLLPCASALLRVARLCDRFGTDDGAMHVTVVSRDSSGTTTRRTRTLIAEHGDGPQIPATPAALIAKKLLALPGYTPITVRGALPCLGLVTIDEILRELRELAIRVSVTD